MSRIGTFLALALLAIVVPVGSAAAQAKQRSAKGVCAREVERRGYAVLNTGNFRQYTDGWQVDIRARDQRGRTGAEQSHGELHDIEWIGWRRATSAQV